jgi:ribosomal protein S18 acetylase RimI-like enzyme
VIERVPSGAPLMDVIRTFLRDTSERVCDETLRTDHGVAMLSPSLPLVWQLNALFVDDSAAGAVELAAEAEELQRGLGHRKLVVHDEELGARLAPDLAAEGWNVFRLLIMVRRRPPDRGAEPGRAAEVSRDEGAAALAAFRREQPFGWQDEAVRQLAEMDARYTQAVRGRDFAAPPDRPACACRLYSDGRLGQVDEVGTLEERRGRGHARAAVLAAADAAAADGLEPVFLQTDSNDWPQRLYEKLGFDGMGCLYEFLKLRVRS